MLNSCLPLVAVATGLYDLGMKKARPGMPRLLVVLSLALIGLMVLQVLLLRYAWDLKEQSFARGARTALAATVVSLESREIEGTAYDYFVSQIDTVGAAGNVVRIESMVPRNRSSRWPGARSVRTELHRSYESSRSGAHLDSVIVVVNEDSDGHLVQRRVHAYQPVPLRKVVGEWINRVPAPIEDRLDREEIRDVLQAELAKVGISATPLFGVIRSRDRSARGFETGDDAGRRELFFRMDTEAAIVMASDHVTDAELLASPYHHRLFPLDPFSSPFDLALVFRQDKLYLFRQIWPLWLASMLFIGVIIVSFGRVWRTNLEQRRFADRLVDFINNMTHEFKTPISTVGLAGEAIARGDVQAEPEVFARYVGMIRDENRRMHRQVEKILQMARFERGDLELKREFVAVQELLAGVAASFTLAVEQRGGTVKLDFTADTDRVIGDRVHLESIFSNLVDNAVKYSPEPPRVGIATATEGGFLLVRISDQGKGIEREDQKRVFEKYYRCPTGNRHDVKGYGLGLSFVKSLVTAHGGFVELHSLPGRGTTVTVNLPLAAGES